MPETPVGVLGFYISVYELHEQGLFQVNPVAELLLGGGY
jgi:hypothetical protein